jgi:hypothetical protein
MDNTITYATNTPEKGYDFCISGTLSERMQIKAATYREIWVYDPSNDESPPEWARYPNHSGD